MKNAIYLPYEWFSGDTPLSESERNEHVLTLKDHGINQQFCDIGVIQDDGTLLPEGYAKVDEWIETSHLVDSKQNIILVLNYGRVLTNPLFATSKFITNLNNAIKHLINTFKIDGIHLDFERFMNNNNNFLKMLNRLKSDALAKKHLSLSTPVSVWSTAYIKSVARFVDQVNPMVYDTMGWGSDVVDAESFETYFKMNVLKYVNALIGSPCELVPTLPAYELKKADDGTIYHDPAVESMKSAISALNYVRDAEYKVDGAGIFWGPHYMGLNPKVYNQYTEDQEEWKTNWLRL